MVFMNNTLNTLAKQIITQNQYMTIATVDADGTPWASPVAYAEDENWNLYFVSMPESRHGKNFANTSTVSVAIFDSHQDWGEGVGVWIEGTITKIPLLKSKKARETYFKRSYPYGQIKMSFKKGLLKLLEGKQYSFYSLTPEKVWINNPDSDVDERMEVDIIT
jgi:nitroimidazol reductase NimA-like FMN-containing flavoprotein (pyridoxamine 5'-phosphate oxidase superfamily)